MKRKSEAREYITRMCVCVCVCITRRWRIRKTSSCRVRERDKERHTDTHTRGKPNWRSKFMETAMQDFCSLWKSDRKSYAHWNFRGTCSNRDDFTSLSLGKKKDPSLYIFATGWYARIPIFFLPFFFTQRESTSENYFFLLCVCVCVCFWLVKDGQAV